ncbi:MAG: uracil-DNA glycosylase [Elioraea sp.]|nr:uracil-DNA glycosylase [Elioraea sp.]
MARERTDQEAQTQRELLAALALQLAWGADEALDEAPCDRFRPASGLAPSTAPKPAPSEGAQRPPAPSVAVAAPFAAPLPGPVAEAQRLAASAETLEALRELFAGFEGCALRETATNFVFADGSPEAPVMLVGEGPGAEEDREGLPFVGPSGRLLDRMLASIGIARRDGTIYITNVLPWRPPGNRSPTDGEIAVCLPFLKRHIALVKPKVLVLAGGVPARALLGAREGITRLRGRWRMLEIPSLLEPIPTLPTLHPAYLLRNPGAKREAWSDLILLRRRLDTLLPQIGRN